MRQCNKIKDEKPKELTIHDLREQRKRWGIRNRKYSTWKNTSLVNNTDSLSKWKGPNTIVGTGDTQHTL